MVLNRYSLRRALRLDFRSTGTYRTRRSRSRSEVSVFYDQPKAIHRAVTDAGYKVLLLSGDGPLSGVLEGTMLWRPNNLMGLHTPMLSHSIIVIGEKVK